MPKSKRLLDKLKAFGLPGMVVTDELQLLAGYAAEVKNAAIVEVGSYLGRSAAAMAEMAREGVKVYAVDPYERYTVNDPQGKPFTYQSVNRMVFIGNIDRLGFGDVVQQVQKYGVDAAEGWSGGPVGMLFIDARHDYESVSADFSAWDPHVMEGGYVAFHDYGPEEGVKQFVDELISDGNYEPVEQVRFTIVLQKLKAVPVRSKTEKTAKASK